MDAPRLLCNSNFCRLCAEENKNACSLFRTNENEQDLSQLVNKYLPLKVERDGKFPIVICPGCNIQLEATKQFLDLVIEGQNKLRDLFRVQQETLRRQEKQKQQLENVLKNVNPNSSVETYTIESDESGEKFLIQIFSDGPLFPNDHELSLRSEGLDKPKRKRGRPPKPPPPTEEELKILNNEKFKEKEAGEAEDDGEFDADGRRKRRIKVPFRYQEAVQGKELDRIFKEEGVIDDDSSDEEVNEKVVIPGKNADEIIGHLQSKEGDDLGELVINKNTNKVRINSKDGMISETSSTKKNYECKICGREFKHHGRFEVHKSFHKVVKYGCGEVNCDVQADNRNVMEEHQKETGHSGVSYIENLDNYGTLLQVPPKVEVIELPSLEEEEEPKCSSQPESDNKFSCSICNKKFSCKQNYEVHNKAVHENQRPYQCDKCEKSFPYINSLKCHLLQHTDNSEKAYECETCKKIFKHPSSLVYHREAEHNNGRRFVCNKCPKSFKHKQLLQRHQLVHSDVRPHNCKMCNANFKTRANLLNHMPIHTGEKKYYCNQCGQSFTHKTSLTLHIRWHSGQKPYECDVCMKTFSQKGNLAEHKRIHTGEKPYCCDHCGRKFTTSSQFKLHVKRHTGERPWRCEYCTKTFLHKDTWKCHTRRHRNERPYQCSQCLRGFTEQWALKKHERLHTGEKPYVCSICQKSFADCSNLTKHKKIHDSLKIRQMNRQGNIKFLSGGNQVEDNQVLYLAYQDTSSNDGQIPTLVHIMDPLANDQDSETLEEDTFLTDALPESLTQYQEVVDENGAALSLTTEDGQSIKVLTTVEEGNQCIKGLMSNGTLVPIGLSMENGKAVSAEILTGDKSDVDNKDNTDKNNIPSSMSNNEDEVQLLENNMEFLDTDGQKVDNGLQFLTQDGQNICLLTAYNMDESINPQYLAMA